MITKNDCYLLLAEIKDKGIDTNSQLTTLVRSADIPIQVIKFINDNRQLDLSKFYEKLRKSYNDKKSSLYINIVKELNEPTDVLTTLSSMLLQIMLFSKNVSNKEMFLKHARFADITKVLYNYSVTFDLIPCIKLLRIIKADLKVLESIK